MEDPISFPVLLGATLTGAITFLYGRIGAVLDRRAGRTPAGEPETLEGYDEPLQIQSDALTSDRVQRLERAAGTLSVYRDHPELAEADIEKLRPTLGQLRQDLETIYGTRFLFGDEQSDRPGINVTQITEDLHGQQRGIKAKQIAHGTNINLHQRSNTVHPGGDLTGIEVDGTIS
ncbi:hypothetical protein GCM10018953_08690 [Streptosporangium nondiastaticum]|uniref:hypothetical protein n=1 Tax=Streptosporangium nondiastaticum TaxID=35764 RepID=UPI0031F989D4